MTAIPDQPISAYDPRFKEFLLRGAREEVRIPCDTEKQAYRLQARMCSFRARVKREKLDFWEQLYQCVVACEKNFVVLRPRRSEFDKALSQVAHPISRSLAIDILGELEKETKEQPDD